MKRKSPDFYSDSYTDSESSSIYSSDSDPDSSFIPYSSSIKSLPIDKCCCGIQVFFINVNQGNFICVKNCRTNKIVIIDVGSSNLKFQDLDSNSLGAIFKNCTISAVIITHLDKDHYNYLEDVSFKKFLGENKVNSSEAIMVCGMSNPNQRALLTKIKIPLKIKYDVIPKTNTCMIQQIDDATTVAGVDITAIEKQINDAFGYPKAFKFCLPTQGIAGKLTKNACSLVVRLSCEGGNILFTGDATNDTFKALSKDPKNVEIFKSTNFFVIPHHGAETAGSNLWLPNIISYAGHNFVGVAVSANPMYTTYAHPRAISVKETFGKSAQKYAKSPLLFHPDRHSDVYYTRTHRCIYEPALLPGKILWLKLENGLSIFDNEAFTKSTDSSESISSFLHHLPHFGLESG